MRKPRRSRRPRRKDGTFKSHSHRTHPAKRNKPGPGICTWCVSPILKADGTPNLRRTFCGPACVTDYLLRTDPKMMRRHVFVRDEGRCGMCGTQHLYLNGDWEADHIEPLFMAFGDPAYWEPENVQLLCHDPCHKKKSKADRERYGFVLKLAKGPPAAKKKRTRLAERLK